MWQKIKDKFRTTIQKDILSDVADDLDNAIRIIDSMRVNGWSSADDDDLKTLKKAQHILRRRSR